MLKKIYSILLIVTFIMVVNKPLIVMAVLYFNHTETVDERCCCETEETETAKMPSNGDAYLKALLKRVCKDTKKDSPRVPSISLTVFVKDLIKEYFNVFYLENKNTEISDFVILKDPGKFPLSLLRPPNA